MGKNDALLIFFLILFVGVFIYLSFLIPYSFFKYVGIPYFKLLIPLKPKYKKLLEDRFPYYHTLSSRNKRKFRYRLNYFLMYKEFIGRENLEVTPEMKILVGAAAVQVTFGFEALQLPYFNRIVLYPRAFYSRRTKSRHKGEVNSSGVIVFSWEDFIKGYQIPDDGYNLGIHEMAHAVKMEDFIPSKEYAFMDNDLLIEWQDVSVKEMKRIRNGENTFLHQYAAKNQEEFFAVSVEQFFEQPEQFKKELPEVYYLLSCLLNQDPLELKKGDER